ncbi:ubiquinol-cytochrome c reductase iron-sulfur subunit [Angustibacter sp. Root456]|uniref:cytochrome bc1 complex Rieske iron-sulfur subunit n=1 Tax=Angustibacter sp. Root456 TaxID=1736539 RepID=UPI0006FCFD26|nr:Rieske 2Fe-2S domain-containing protein [Angustibacter sp. Root456]KQX64450.1 ubiquinol-cytochrome C reductase [Angustibacter sp. Root456]
MSDTTPARTSDVPTPERAVALPGTTAAPTLFENPGLPPHPHRMADVDPRAAKRAERQVAAMFTLSMLATLVFLVSYFAVSMDQAVYVPFIGAVRLQHLLLGLGLGFGLFFIGVGAIHWAKTLMPDEEVVEERHQLRSSDQTREAAVETLQEGAESSGIARRPLIKATLGGALGLFGLPFIVALRDLGPLPGDRLSHTMWKAGMRLVSDPELAPIKASDVTVGSVFHVMPEGIDKVEDILEQRAKAAVLLMRLNPNDIKSAKERDWGYEGIVAYSKICTHVGCPVGLYEQQTHHLLCPCHQSTFDVTEDAKVIFGPAHRPLPQLAITVNDEGYLVARQPFQEAVGPSFPERGHR